MCVCAGHQRYCLVCRFLKLSTCGPWAVSLLSSSWAGPSTLALQSMTRYVPDLNLASSRFLGNKNVTRYVPDLNLVSSCSLGNQNVTRYVPVLNLVSSCTLGNQNVTRCAPDLNLASSCTLGKWSNFFSLCNYNLVKEITAVEVVDIR